MTDALGDLNPSRARLLLEMAEAALRDPPGAVVLPDGWDVVQSFRSDGGALPHGRGFYAAGSPDGPGTERVAVLALGLPWAEYLDWSKNPGGEVKLAALPAGVAADAPAEARFEAWLGAAYSLMRTPIWSHLPLALREGGGRLWITGMNLGGPLAQLAALDLRPGKQPPSTPVLTSTFPCWTFSSPPAGNTALKTFADAKGGAVVNVWAGKETVVDLYPTAPDAAQGFALPGKLEQVATPIPKVDDPWTERGGPFYLRMLGGTPDGLPSPARIVNPPAGFDRTRAHALAGICMTAYRRRLRPGDIDPTVTDLTSGGVRWGVLIVTSAEAVVAFRGTVTADEMARVTADSEVVRARFLDPSGARVHGGALRLYTAPITTPTSSPLRTEIVRLLKEKAAGKPVYLCGHDLGGALAALAALDLRVTAPDVKVAKVYGFGGTPVGDLGFAGLYRTRLRNDATQETDSYLLMRDVDFARRLRLVGAYEPIPSPILVQGAPADDDASRHSLASYVALLDPSGRQPAQV